MGGRRIDVAEERDHIKHGYQVSVMGEALKYLLRKNLNER